MLIKEIDNYKSYYDILRFSKALKLLARKSNNPADFYQRHLVLNLILQIMKKDPTSSKIMELVNDQPWGIRDYLIKKVIKVFPNGEKNINYKPKQ